MVPFKTFLEAAEATDELLATMAQDGELYSSLGNYSDADFRFER